MSFDPKKVTVIGDMTEKKPVTNRVYSPCANLAKKKTFKKKKLLLKEKKFSF